MEGTHSSTRSEAEMQTNGAAEKGHKTYTIIVNAREKTITTDELTFDQVIQLAYDDPPSGENMVFTVLYRRAHGNKDGTLVEGQSVKVKDGMIFDVTATNKS